MVRCIVYQRNSLVQHDVNILTEHEVYEHQRMERRCVSISIMFYTVRESSMGSCSCWNIVKIQFWELICCALAPNAWH